MARPKTHNDELAERLITEARTMITNDGLDALNLRALASNCGTSTAAIYSLFSGKDPLITAVILRVLQEYIAAQSSVVITGDPDRDIEALSRMYRLWATQNAEIYTALYQGDYTATSYVDTLIDEALAPWYQVIDEARDRGYTTDDVETIIFRAWQTLHGGIMLELGNTLVPDEDLLMSSVNAQIHYSSGRTVRSAERKIHPDVV